MSFVVGQRVCVIGRGTANLVHAHYTVDRLTAKQVVVSRQLKGRKVERRYWAATGREVGGSEYGGTTVSERCQRPERV